MTRQRTSFIPPVEYDPQEESQAGIPSTIEVAFEVQEEEEEDENGIPFQIEVRKMRAPSRRYLESQELDQDDSSSDASSRSDVSRSSGESTSTSVQYDEYLYGSRTEAPTKSLMLKILSKKEKSTCSSMTSLEKEGAALTASYLVQNARQAARTTTAPKPTSGPPSTRKFPRNQNSPMIRASSVPVIPIQGINVRESVDSYHSDRRCITNNKQHPPPNEIGVTVSSRELQRQPSERSVVAQSTLAMIFKPQPEPPSNKQHSTRTVKSNGTTHTQTDITTSSHPLQHSMPMLLLDDSGCHANDNSSADILGASMQDHSDYVGYVIDNTYVHQGTVDLHSSSVSRRNHSQYGRKQNYTSNTNRKPSAWSSAVVDLPTTSTVTATSALTMTSAAGRWTSLSQDCSGNESQQDDQSSRFVNPKYVWNDKEIDFGNNTNGSSKTKSKKWNGWKLFPR